MPETRRLAGGAVLLLQGLLCTRDQRAWARSGPVSRYLVHRCAHTDRM